MDPVAPRDEVAELRSECERLRSMVEETQEQYRRLFECYPHPTWVFCLDSLRFLAVNQATVRVYGWSRDELLSMTISAIRPPDEVPQLAEQLARYRGVSDGVTSSRHRRKDGGIIEVEVSFHTLCFSGRAARLVVACDVGERRRALLEAMRAVAHEPGMVARVLRATSDAGGRLRLLSPREREVFARVAEGLTSREIAEDIGLSVKSVETYRARFMQKLGARSRADIVRCALECGVIQGA